jgi:hypothetical protein
MAVPIFISPFFMDYVLPFVLVFTLVFALLQKTKILGDGKKQIDSLVALIKIGRASCRERVYRLV